MNNVNANPTGTSTGSIDKDQTTEQSATFAKKDAAAEGAPASKVDVSRPASDNAPVTDASKRHADDAGKSQR